MFTRKLERLHQPPAILDKYDNEEYMKNPLLKFHLADIYERRYCTLLKYRAAEEKIKLARKRLPTEADIRYLPESHYVDNLKRARTEIKSSKELFEHNGF